MKTTVTQTLIETKPETKVFSYKEIVPEKVVSKRFTYKQSASDAQIEESHSHIEDLKQRNTKIAKAKYMRNYHSRKIADRNTLKEVHVPLTLTTPTPTHVLKELPRILDDSFSSSLDTLILKAALSGTSGFKILSALQDKIDIVRATLEK